jgi:hypothetical protein
MEYNEKIMLKSGGGITKRYDFHGFVTAIFEDQD